MLTDFDNIRRNGSHEYTGAMRTELSEWIGHFHPRWMLTFNFNSDISLDGAHCKMRQCLMRIEHAKFGRNWSRKPAKLRARAIAVMEHPDSNSHWHCAVRTLRDDWGTALEAGKRYWEAEVPAGSLHIAPVTNVEGLASYMTKSQYMGAHLDAMFFYAPERPSHLEANRR